MTFKNLIYGFIFLILLKKNIVSGLGFWNAYHLTPLSKVKKDSLIPLLANLKDVMP